MAKKVAMWFGWILVILGVLGFFGNPIVGSSAGAWFMADAAHNVVHIVLGAILLWTAYGAAGKSAGALKVIGVILVLLAIAGFFSSTGSVLGLVMSNGGSDWLHLILGIIFTWGGMSRGRMASAPMGQTM